MNEILPVDISKVTKAYSGIDGKCCCGCSGNYYYNTIKPLPSYMDESDIKVSQVRRIVNLINNNLSNADSDTNYTCVVIGKRLYIAYND